MQKKEKLLIDSNFFVALSKNGDNLLERAEKLLEQILYNYELYITNHIFVEILTVVSQKVDKITASKIAIALNSGEFGVKVKYSDSNLELLALKYFLSDTRKNISMVDCISLAAIDYYGFKYFLSFDETDFKKYQNKLKFKLIS